MHHNPKLERCINLLTMPKVAPTSAYLGVILAIDLTAREEWSGTITCLP